MPPLDSLSMSVEQLPAEDAVPSGRYDGVLRYYELAKRAEWQVADLEWGEIPPIPEARGSAEKLAVCDKPTFSGASAGGPYYNIWAYARTAWPEWNPVFGYQITGPASKFQVSPTFKGATATCDPRYASAPRSAGILVGLGDGSVRMLASGVSPDTWWRACTPDGGEVLGNDW